ncbi:MAG: tRNA (N6-isopentenyl adenosine(37)-C2)-methylthiotransferase MiaB [Deltaproteobacteria bacterium CG_4_10_14_0_2_um_filter_43_8]|nr:MAG: tRNA (N6-isopentenyl adenosine(37)-C2)-methylthiotransferase MiaB [Deltaproteobacteria bacterium CG11_big_fil_rev_8_21_14_0_20_42_23]PJA21649.1 MAG: tRNA (N6-isopentenyl adenosine(37)-C2)-methylthiotransferase MiaB [Deltaproteobacteria bacterium CG_4_10_14_0_2_um_filter_43_8]PJC63783.1 MAG: tRNA (N6-isopentenyl adenosine(37)-C2)-methylthiotransferase MiaB [Deltaproteobacteria bacterium CG_4_9_14_0_2_um_filter_42_21]
MDSQKKVYLKTFGCQMNEHDSQAMLNMLKRQGYQTVSKAEDADLILYNTCTIREKAYHKAMSDLGRAKEHKKLRDDVQIGITGCAAQQGKEDIARRFKHVDFILGPDQLLQLPSLAGREKSQKAYVATELINDSKNYEFLDVVPDHDVEGSTAFVSIMKGCNCKCSYCIVPAVRGREVYRTGKEVVDDIKRLVDRGVKEVMLLGQNVASYRDPLYGDAAIAPIAGTGNQPRSLAALIRLIADNTNIERIRFTSPHPRDIEDTLIEAYRDVEKLCGQIHLPAQSGSNAMLKRMRRGYTREHYLNIVEKVRAARPGIAISTDLIVGFCGETDEEFQDSLSLLREVQYDALFAFSYSERPGTYATSSLQDDVPEKVKKARLKELLQLDQVISFEKNKQLVGKVVSTLVTGFDKHGHGKLQGRADDNRLIHFQGDRSLIGSIVPVMLTEARGNSLEGELLFNDHSREYHHIRVNSCN